MEDGSGAVFLLGARGFVGSAFARLFARLGRPCHALEVDSYGAHAGEDCPILIHAAGNSRKYLADDDPAADFEQSVSLVMRALRDYRPALFILISTVDVYNCLDDPNRNHEDAVIDPLGLSAYGFHKILAEYCVRRHATRWMIARLAGMVGPGLGKGPIFDILHRQPLRIHPDSRYQFLPTDEVADVVWELAQNAPGGIYNVCGTGLVSPREIASLAGRALDLSALGSGARPRIVHVDNGKVRSRFRLSDSRGAVTDFLRATGTDAAPAAML